MSTVDYEKLRIFKNDYKCQRLSTEAWRDYALIISECHAVNAVNAEMPPFAVLNRAEEKTRPTFGVDL